LSQSPLVCSSGGQLLVLQHLDHRGLLAADVAARADEDLDGKRQHPLGLRLGDGGAHARDLLGILVADVHVAAPRLQQQPGDEHALQHQVRCAQEDLAVLERARLALVAAAHDVLLVAGRHVDVVPLLVGAAAGAAHAEQPGHPQPLDHLPAGRGGLGAARADPRGQLARRRVVRLATIDVDLPGAAVVVVGVVIGRRHAARGEALQELATLRGAAAGIAKRLTLATGTVHLDRHGRRPVAAPETGHALDGELLGRPHGRQGLAGVQELAAAAQAAGHVAADAHVHLGRRRRPELWEEADHLVHAVERHAEACRDGGQLCARDEPARTV